MEKKTIEVSGDLYEAIQKLKEVFFQLTGQKVVEDEDVLSILIGGFIDSLSQGQDAQAQGQDAQGQAGEQVSPHQDDTQG